MQARKRYVLVLASCAFLALCYLGGYRLKTDTFEGKRAVLYRRRCSHQSYVTAAELVGADRSPAPSLRRRDVARMTATKDCDMESCFDFSRCRSGFKIYVYPSDDEVLPPPSIAYRKVLDAARSLPYVTNDPSEACILLPSMDTLDRDSLSPDYVRNAASRLQRMRPQTWGDGRNHLLFNLYSGTWPDYAEDDLGFDTGRAIVARASSSKSAAYRPGFDIALPLFPKSHPERGGESGTATINAFPLTKRYLLAFKGKRYVYGIGSETRNALHHLHNGRDVVLVTTCRHGKSWREMKDERCDDDNAHFDRYDYDDLLSNATFCLVPRGRRLGSFRFLEALQAGCIPVLLSNGWELPFGEVIHWPSSVIAADERLLLQVPESVRSVPPDRVLALRQQTQLLWERYFSSVDKIVRTTIEIIRDRVERYQGRDSTVWNNMPGGLLTIPGHNYGDGSLLPFFQPTQSPSANYTAVIYVTQASPFATVNSPLPRLLRNVARSKFVSRIILLWATERTPPALPLHPRHWWVPPPHASTANTYIPPVTLLLRPTSTPSISWRFHPQPLIQTDAVLALDDDALLTADEMDFAYRVWKAFPERIVGYPARSHYWDDAKNAWGYTSKWTNDYSMVLSGAAIYHRYYHRLYVDWTPPVALAAVERSQNCEDILLNFVVAHATRRPPIKVTQRKQYKEHAGTRSSWSDPDHFVQRQSCLNEFAQAFGYMPLVRSSLRLDPVLFKDPVSNLRKKYRQIELVGRR